jgi:alanine dehydrogenase
LTNATLPYAIQLANKGWKQACTDNHSLKLGLNVINGKVVYRGVAEAFDLKLHDVEGFLE